MEAIHIPHLLKMPDKAQTVQVDDYFNLLETLTPVRGSVRVAHRGTFLEVAGQAETIVTLTCHRCLQNYNHRLMIQPSELIWLNTRSSEANSEALEQEVLLEDLVETLTPMGHFHVEDWLYQQICLALPQRQLCQKDCEGIQLEDATQSALNPVDHRWAGLASLKALLPDGDDD